ncbi:hydroxymethylbilane synthase [soil metagenome]
MASRENNNSQLIRIGTRGSRLALWQTHYVAELLRADGFEIEMVIISTKGDQVLDRSLDKIGAKGVFTEELEESLRVGTVDIAVHSAKDLQSSLPEDLEILAYMEREKINDVVISFDSSFTLDRPQIIVGTSSTRRRALLSRYYPNAIVAESRGNLQTRLKKLEEKQYDALILAYAGVIRMKYDHLVTEVLDDDQFVPAAGQGSIAIESAKSMNLAKKLRLRACLNHAETAVCLQAERAYLRTMEGGCSIPSFALATLTEGQVRLKAGIISLDGQELIKEEMQGPVEEAEALGQRLAEVVLQKGGDRILKAIREVRSEA